MSPSILRIGRHLADVVVGAAAEDLAEEAHRLEPRAGGGELAYGERDAACLGAAETMPRPLEQIHV